MLFLWIFLVIVFNFDHFFHYDGIYFFSHNHICFAPLCLYLCILVVLSLLYHKKDDVILPNSGVAKKNWWLLLDKIVIGGCDIILRVVGVQEKIVW